MHGKCILQEEQVMCMIIPQLSKFTCIKLNDFTRADMILKRISELLYVNIQLKTTLTNLKNQPNIYHFKQTNGYEGMILICYAVDIKKFWVFNGSYTGIPKSGGLSITIGGKHCKSSLSKGPISIDELSSCIEQNMNSFPRITEEEARHKFNSKAHAKEYRGLELYNKLVTPIEIQTGQTTVDAIHQKEKNCQFKSAKLNAAGWSGFNVNLFKSSGKDKNGKRLVGPYEKGDFDVLVVMYETSMYIHVWEIPENKIKLKDDNTKGVMGLNVHASEEDRIKFNFGPPPSPISCKSLWTREYYSKYKIF